MGHFPFLFHPPTAQFSHTLLVMINNSPVNSGHTNTGCECRRLSKKEHSPIHVGRGYLLPFPSKQYSQCYSMSPWAALHSRKHVLPAQPPREERHARARQSNFPSFTFQCYSTSASPDFGQVWKAARTFYEMLEELQASSPSYQRQDAFTVL